MKYVSEFRDSALAKGLIAQVCRLSSTPARFMEFCGGHTVTIFRYGIRQVLPQTVTMVSGPGCPVCVTANKDLDKTIALAHFPDVILATFGDMLRIPGSHSSLQQAKAEGADVRMVYSAMDALNIARENPEKHVIFVGIGFETTAPTIAASVLQAAKEGLDNYYILSLHKLSPPVVKALLDSGEVNLDGFICPGHVSTVTGSQAWEFISRDYGIPCVVSGFEPLDVLHSISMLVSQVETKRAEVEIAYRRGVQPEGNPTALRLMREVFAPCPADWRGMGEIPASGLKLREAYLEFDAETAFDIDSGPTRETEGCLCGQILRGVATPQDCPLFGKACTPEEPVGPCMVSSEGSCSAYYRYGGEHA